jgi:hypothetical protein
MGAPALARRISPRRERPAGSATPGIRAREAVVDSHAVGDRRWLVDAMGGDLKIELVDFPSSDGAATRRSERELDGLLGRGLSARDPSARRVLEEVYDALRGGRAAPRQGNWVRGPSFEGALAQALRFAVYSGALKVERVDRVRVVPPPTESAAETALGPDSTRDAPPATKTWVGVTLADQNGTPIPNRAYRIIKPDGTTVDGTLDSNGSAILQGLDPGSCQIWCPYVEPRPATTYAVADGDHISGIAQSYGYDDYTALWSDPGNADLQSQRSDPHVLQPGDSLTIPELKAQPAANKPTSAKHPFTLNVSPLKLRVTMLDLMVKPMASAPVTVAGTSLTTDGQGLAEAPVDKTARDATLVSAGNDVELSLGGLNPSDDTSEAGYKARLYNLGFLWDPSAEDTDNEMLIALQDFQAQYSLTVSGELDDATKGQLLQAHGC